MKSTKLVRISSRFRDDEKTQSTTDFTVSFNETNYLQNVVSCQLKNASIPNTYYNINSSNNKFVCISDNSFKSFLMDEGYYNFEEFKASFILEMSNVGITVNDFIKKQNGKIQITTNVGINYYKYSESVPITSNNYFNPMADVLGIVDDTGADVLIYTADNLPMLQGLTAVYIESPELAQNQMIESDKSQFSTRHVLDKVLIDVPFGLIQAHESGDVEDDIVYYNTISGRNINQISVKITDEGGNVVDLNGQHVELLIRVFFG